jgi:exopolysaccharide biosynthesis polyprenyl glycosylphosphotransferase
MSTVNELNFPDAHTRLHPPRHSRLAEWAKRVQPAHWKYWLVGGDVALILVALTIAYYVRYELQWFRAVDPVFLVDLWAYLPFALALVLILPISFRLSGVYPYQRGRSWFEETYAIATATTLGVMVLIIASLFFRPLLYSRLIFLYTALLVTVLLGTSRVLYQLAFEHLRHYGVGVKRVVLVGAGDVGRMVIRTMTARPDFGYQLVGFLDDNPVKGHTNIGPYRALGAVENLAQVLASEQVDSVIICLPWQSHRMIQRLLRTCEQRAVRAQVVPDLFQLTKNQVYVEDLNGIPLIGTRGVSIQGWNLWIKRASDLLLGGIAGLISLPVCLLIALAIKLDSPGPVLFVQTRIGRNGVPFACFKFRSMIDGADTLRRDWLRQNASQEASQVEGQAVGQPTNSESVNPVNDSSGPLFKMHNDPRRTRVGRFIRRYSLDELPQILNVLRGEMSLVGPRPNLPDEVAQYQEWHTKRLTVSPGITGLWQVSGRSDLTFDEMVLLDIYYVENWNLAMDLGILLRSLPAVIQARGAY